MMVRTTTRSSLARLTTVMACCTFLSACTEGVLLPKGPVGAQEKQLLLEALIPMLMVITPIILLTLWFAWWFRASNAKATYRPRWEYSGAIEFSIWMIPLLVILFLGSLAWIGAHQLDPYQPLASKRKPLVVQVVAMDWRWLFIYPEQGVASVNELAIPVDTPVSFRLTSATVMNSFFIPSLGGQIYAMPGMQTQLQLQASESGNYRGLSAQYSGAGFSDMHFQVLATDEAGFQMWVRQAKSAATRLDSTAYDRLAAEHKVGKVAYYSPVSGALFDHAIDHATKRTESTSGVAASNPGTTLLSAGAEH
ncbi:MAG TPA: ubiquinol oxidase subunit II [Pinirhizobacter sp.]|uniref:ubiquinol oxidase subunit II n=1 Tax=Pinirhizobacter sp. TaxID=2950432 RepID=UPI002CEC6537|nr:ubiquinol oxidase subunit II [Pinirhizobacter sp.]HMH69267.1 ubiquinol oxidase subunit II [Pinirhizobacter sp.]